MTARHPLPSMRPGDASGFSLVEMVAFLSAIVTIAAFVLPLTRTAMRALDLSGDARHVASAVQLTKLRAASDFSHARLRVNLAAGTYWMERWQKGAGAWVPEGAAATLTSGVTFGAGGIAAPPPSTQPALAQAPACLDDWGAPVAGTACIIFNSRGIPVDDTGAPFPNDALYLSDGSVVFGVTVSAGGLVRLWRANAGGGEWAPY